MTEPDTIPKIDVDTLSRYFEVVFGYLEGIVPIRMLAETGTGSQPPKLEFPSVKASAAALARLAPIAAREGRGLYVVPGTVAISGSAKSGDVVETGVLLIDIDVGDIAAKRAHLEQHIGTPSLIVASGGVAADGQAKLHLYWRLTEAARGVDLETVRVLRAELARKAGGDPSFARMHQPIRVAGSIHGKNAKQRPVQLLEDTHREYHLADLVEAVEAMPALAGATLAIDTGRGSRKGPTAAELATRVVREGGVDGVTRFDALTSVMGHWLRNARLERCSYDEAWAAIRDHNAAMIVPPWEDARLRGEFDALLARDIRNHGPLPVAAPLADGPAEPASFPPEQSDDALAAAFVAAHGTCWRYISVWGAWFHWTGTYWQKDETGLVREVVRLICRGAADGLRANDARRIASDKTIAAVMRVAAADPAVAVRSSDWDAHPMLLNTTAGIIDLETGEIGPHDPERLLTQITSTSPGGDCPRWRTFLTEITGGDADLEAYLARLAGYCLTGSTAEQVFAFFQGSGANGKSVFLQTIAAVMGTYAATATLDTFMETKAGRHLTELAGLRSARIVIVPETEAGRSWAEGRIKMVTGGEKVRANFMHRDHFEFVPRFKLVVMGNHRPALTGVGEAMRRRMQVVPFAVTIPPDRRDPKLITTLMAERAGILGWMLDGCAEWQRIGLAAPDCVRVAAEDYFDSEDVVGQWIDETCQLGPNERAASRALYASWVKWCDAEGHSPGSARALGEALRARGFKPAKVAKGRGRAGIGLRKILTSVEAAE
jgi:putative DNA primase/helicase